MRRADVVVVGVIAVAPVAVWAGWHAVTAMELIEPTRTRDEGTVVAETLAVAEWCGAETTVVVDLEHAESWPVPSAVAGRAVTGTVVGVAVACSDGAALIDGRAVMLPAPRVRWSYVDLDVTALPGQERGVLDRLTDSLSCLVGDCGSVVDPVHEWLADAENRVAEQAAEQAIATAREQIPRMVAAATGATVEWRTQHDQQP